MSFKKINIFFIAIFFLGFLFISKPWFSQGVLSGGDWHVFYKESISERSYLPYIWDPTSGSQLGQNISFILAFKTFIVILRKFFLVFLNQPWEVTERIIFFIPFWFFSVLSSYIFAGHFFTKRWQKFLTVIIYSTNTYALMLVGGGQMGVALSYSMAPLIAVFLLKIKDVDNILVSKKNYTAGLLCGLHLAMDPRIAGVTLVATGIFFTINFLTNKKIIPFFSLMYSLLIAILLNFFWILPFIIVRDAGLSAAYTESGIVKFLSFATFENSFSLLHPNWPENIFGKVRFMQPEFLILPILAFMPLIFLTLLKKEKKNYILALSLAALLGIFLGKGTNPPFGAFYTWLSDNLPGFIIFRDSTKWYLLIALSYSVLIPFAVGSLADKIKDRFKIRNLRLNFQILLFAFFLIYWVFTIRPLFLGEVRGTFEPKQIPQEYIRFKDFVLSQGQFFRTFWIPTYSRYGYFSNTNPAIPSFNYLNTSSISSVLNFISKETSEKKLQNASVKYIVVPYDRDAEIFLKDRKYDEDTYLRTVESIRRIGYLKEVEGFGKIKVFEVADNKPHFWSESKDLRISYEFDNPTRFKVYVSGARKGDLLVFSEAFNSYWSAINSNFRVQSSEFEGRLNSFILPMDGNYSFEVYYELQKLVNVGIAVSVTILILSLFLLIRAKR